LLLRFINTQSHNKRNSYAASIYPGNSDHVARQEMTKMQSLLSNIYLVNVKVPTSTPCLGFLNVLVTSSIFSVLDPKFVYILKQTVIG